MSKTANNSTLFKSSAENCSEIVLKPFEYVTSLPSKNIREKLAAAFNFWFQLDRKKVDTICKIISILHNASLIVDDIEDGSDLRRGFSSTHKVYGLPYALNSANYAYFKALQHVLELGTKKGVEIYTEQMIALHEGQGMEIFWRDADSIVSPTEEQYHQIVVKKASGLFKMMIELMELETFEEDKRDFGPFIYNFSLYFQMRDDYLNLNSKEYEDTKGYCEDITEGKLSFPVIHALAHGDEVSKRRIMEILKMRTTDISLKKKVFQMLQETGSMEYTKKTLINLQAEILQEIQILGGNPLLEKLCNQILRI